MQKKITYLLLVAAFFVSYLIFWGIIHNNIGTDIQAHTDILRVFIKNNSFPIPPLYYFLLYGFSGFSVDANVLNSVAVVILAFAVTFKYWTSFKLVDDVDESRHNTTSGTAILLFMLLFSMPVFYDVVHKYMYIGRLATNVWHNSTTILAMPFVVLLFHQSVKFIKNPEVSNRNVGYLLLLGLVNILIKPSFLFALIPALPFIVLLKSGIKSRKFWTSCAIGVILLALIAIEYYIIYQLEILNMIYTKDKGGVEINPFGFWSIYSDRIPLDAFVSLIFPLAYAVLFFKDIKANVVMQYTLYLFFFAMVIGIFMAEKGDKAPHGNFFWQIIMTNYLLFVIFGLAAWNKVRTLGWKDKKSIVLMSVFALHMASGAFYIFKLFYTGVFL